MTAGTADQRKGYPHLGTTDYPYGKKRKWIRPSHYTQKSIAEGKGPKREKQNFRKKIYEKK